MFKEHRHNGRNFALSTAIVLLSTSILVVEGKESAFLRITSCIPNDAHGTRREVWTGLPQGKLRALEADSRYPTNPTTSEFVQSFEAPRGRGNMYGQKLSTYLIPPETGKYVFYMACDDQCELMVSGDEDPSHAQSIIKIMRWTPYRKWDYLPENGQRSAEIYMTAGQLYYAQAVMTQGRGSNHLSVGAKFPSGRYDRPLSNEYLLRFALGAYGVASPGEWGQWSSCTVSCGIGVQIRNRTCLDTLPIFSEIDMTQPTMEARSCVPFYSCPAPPTQALAETVNSSSIKVSWTHFNLTSSAMKLIGYEIIFKRFLIALQTQTRLRRTINQATNTAFNHMIIGEVDMGHVMVPASHQSAVLIGLSSYSVYCIQVATITNIWKSEPSACVNVTTAEDVPSSPPLNVSTKNLTSAHKIYITWLSIPSRKQNGKLLGYRVRVRPLTTANREPESTGQKMFTVLTPRLTTVLTGLESFTVYSIQVTGFTVVGDGPYSAPVIAETCRCPKRMYTNWWILPPLTTRSLGMNDTQGIFPPLLQNMIHYACDLCHGHRTTTVYYDEPSPKEKNHTLPIKESQLQVRKHIKPTTHLNYPLSVEKGGQLSGEGFRFVPVIEVSSAVVYIKKKMSGEIYAKMLGSSLFSCWPIIVLILTLSLLAGTILCILETISNPQQTTHQSSFLRAVYNYSWCAFISMTSVGYGDRYPRSNQGRIFTIVWFIVGYVIICVFVATLSSSLSVKIVVITKSPSQGGKVGVLERTVEYRVATKINGTKGTHCISYKILEEMLTDLKQGYIDGILLDTLSSNNLNKSALPETEFGVAKAFDVSLNYGVGLSGDAIKLEQLFNEYIKTNPVSLDDNRKKQALQTKMHADEEASTSIAAKKVQEVKQVNFFDPSNTMYVMSLHFASGFLIGAILSGIFYHYICSRKRLVKRGEDVKLDLHSTYAVLRFNKYKIELREVLETFYRRCTTVAYRLKSKHKEQRKLLQLELCQSRSAAYRYRRAPVIQYHRDLKENGFTETHL